MVIIGLSIFYKSMDKKEDRKTRLSNVENGFEFEKEVDTLIHRASLEIPLELTINHLDEDNAQNSNGTQDKEPEVEPFGTRENSDSLDEGVLRFLFGQTNTTKAFKNEKQG